MSSPLSEKTYGFFTSCHTAQSQRHCAFIQVQSPPARPAPTATLPNGLIVAIPPGSDLGWTRQVLTALLGVVARC
jgi:hypothetical protein